MTKHLPIQTEDYECMAISAIKHVEMIENTDPKTACELFGLFQDEYVLLGQELDMMTELKYGDHREKWWGIGGYGRHQKKLKCVAISIINKLKQVSERIDDLECAAKKEYIMDWNVQLKKNEHKSVLKERVGAYLRQHPSATEIDVLSNLGKFNTMQVLKEIRQWKENDKIMRLKQEVMFLAKDIKDRQIDTFEADWREMVEADWRGDPIDEIVHIHLTIHPYLTDIEIMDHLPDLKASQITKALYNLAMMGAIQIDIVSGYQRLYSIKE